MYIKSLDVLIEMRRARSTTSPRRAQGASLHSQGMVYKEDDLYVAICPEFGTASQGYTPEEALMNLKEATELYLKEFPLSEAK